MPKSATRKAVRRSVTLSPEVDTKVRKIAGHENRSAGRVLESLIAAGLEAKEAERRRFFEVAERLRSTEDEAEVPRLKEELARMIFGN